MRRAALALLLGVACGAPVRPLPPPDLEPHDLIDGETYARRIAGLRATLARSNVQIDTRSVIETCGGAHDAEKCVRCEVADRRATSGFDPNMIDGVAIAFARYPTSVFAAAKLEHVALCRTIRVQGGSTKQPAGVALVGDHRLLVSIEHFVRTPHSSYAYFTIEQVVHHELFHLLDHEMLGTAVDADREWTALNPVGFTYRDPAPEREKRPLGFVNNYATTSQSEDRASLFEYLMGQPARLCEIAASDPIVAAKTAIIWSRVAKITGEELLHRSAPCIGWIDQKPNQQAKLPKQHGPKPPDPDKPSLVPRRRSILGKMR